MGNIRANINNNLLRSHVYMKDNELCIPSNVAYLQNTMCLSPGALRQLKAVARVQNALNENDIMGKMLPLLCRNSDTMVREILAFLSVMLFAANANVQVKSSQLNGTIWSLCYVMTDCRNCSNKGIN